MTITLSAAKKSKGVVKTLTIATTSPEQASLARSLGSTLGRTAQQLLSVSSNGAIEFIGVMKRRTVVAGGDIGQAVMVLAKMASVQNNVAKIITMAQRSVIPGLRLNRKIIGVILKGLIAP